MTIAGAIKELQSLLEADDVPFYYKVGIEKVIETLYMEIAPRVADTPQTETSTNGEKLQSEVELKQTDCGWK